MKVPYFSHDADARRDPKMTALIGRFGMAGYGSFWVIVEMLREEENYRLPHKSFAFEAIGSEIKMSPEEAKIFVNDLIENFELLRSDEKYFWSESLLRRMALMNEKSEKNRRAAQKRWENERCRGNANAS